MTDDGESAQSPPVSGGAHGQRPARQLEIGCGAAAMRCAQRCGGAAVPACTRADARAVCSRVRCATQGRTSIGTGPTNRCLGALRSRAWQVALLSGHLLSHPEAAPRFRRAASLPARGLGIRHVRSATAATARLRDWRLERHETVAHTRSRRDRPSVPPSQPAHDTITTEENFIRTTRRCSD